MSVVNYTCERCGKEKSVVLEEGERLEDKMCGCHSHSDNSQGFMVINAGAIASSYKHDSHSHACGCGGNCGCH